MYDSLKYRIDPRSSGLLLPTSKEEWHQMKQMSGLEDRHKSIVDDIVVIYRCVPEIDFSVIAKMREDVRRHRKRILETSRYLSNAKDELEEAWQEAGVDITGVGRGVVASLISETVSRLDILAGRLDRILSRSRSPRGRKSGPVHDLVLFIHCLLIVETGKGLSMKQRSKNNPQSTLDFVIKLFQVAHKPDGKRQATVARTTNNLVKNQIPKFSRITSAYAENWVKSNQPLLADLANLARERAGPQNAGRRRASVSTSS